MELEANADAISASKDAAGDPATGASVSAEPSRGTGSAAANPDEQIRAAAELRKHGKLAEAERLIREILASDPRRTVALIELGHLCRMQGRIPEALTAFETAAANHPEHLGLQLEIIRSMRMLQRLDDAESLILAALAAHPRDIGVLIELGHIKRSRRDQASSLSAFKAAAEIDKAHMGVRVEIAVALRLLGRNDDAEAALRGLDAPGPVVALARLLSETYRGWEADKMLRRASETSPAEPAFPLARASIAREAGDMAGALGHLATAARIDPTNIELQLDVAGEERRQGCFVSAIERLKGLLADRPDVSRAWMELGHLHRALGDRAASTAAFEGALKQRPTLTQAFVELAADAWEGGQPVAAAAFRKRALEQAPTHLGALLLSAEQLLRAGAAFEALDHARRAMLAHPGEMAGYSVAARAAAALPDKAQALDILDRAESVFGPRPGIAAARIHVLRAMGYETTAAAVAAEIEDSVAHDDLWAEVLALRLSLGDLAGATRVVAALPDESKDGRVHFFTAQIAEANRRYDEAAAEYQAALRLDPANGGWHGEAARASLLRLDLDGTREHLRLAMQCEQASILARGHSSNASQHHVGQLLDEYALDDELVAELRRCEALPADERSSALQGLVRSHPDSTAAATMLLLELRRSGEFARQAGATSTNSPIPAHVVQFWDSGTPPADIRNLMRSWTSDEVEVRLFDNRSAEAFLREHFAADVVGAFRRSHHPAQRSDLFRLAYLAMEGGLYADADDRLKDSRRNLIPASATFVGYQENYGTLANDVLAAVPHHPVIVRALDLAVVAINRGDHDTVWLATGPGLLTRALATILAMPEHASACQGMVIHEFFEMRRLVQLHCPARYKSTSQHWSRANENGAARDLAQA